MDKTVGNTGVAMPATGKPVQSSVGRELGSQASDIAHHGAEQARRLRDSARKRVLREVEERKSTLVAQLESIAKGIEHTAKSGAGQGGEAGHELADGIGHFVRRIERLLDQSSTEELLRKAETKVKERPAVLIAGCLALGFLGARLLRS